MLLTETDANCSTALCSLVNYIAFVTKKVANFASWRRARSLNELRVTYCKSSGVRCQCPETLSGSWLGGHNDICWDYSERGAWKWQNICKMWSCVFVVELIIAYTCKTYRLVNPMTFKYVCIILYAMDVSDECAYARAYKPQSIFTSKHIFYFEPIYSTNFQSKRKSCALNVEFLATSTS